MAAEEKNRWLPYRREVEDCKLRLICFSGGGASTFTSWWKNLPAAVEVCPVQFPGRENRVREPAITRIPQLVSQLMGVLDPLLDRPFALFGHSVGALAAFELARQLRRQGLGGPEWLLTSGYPAPQLPQRRPAVSHLAPPEFWQAMRDHYSMDPVLLGSEDMKSFLYPGLRADYELVETYVYEEEPPFSFPISVFGGSHDPETTDLELLAWQKHTTGRFRKQILEGDHTFIKTARDSLVYEVAQDLGYLMAANASRF
jgi:medium-chain acyl-[acyl-carrier-protein] hydrolase